LLTFSFFCGSKRKKSKKAYKWTQKVLADPASSTDDNAAFEAFSSLRICQFIEHKISSQDFCL